MLEEILAYEGNVNLSTSDGNTAMHLGSVMGQVDAIEYLSEKSRYNYWQVVYYSVFQCVAVCCTVLQYDAVYCRRRHRISFREISVQ